MNKKFIFLSSIIAASVIIGVTINIINANNNKNSDISTNNDATEIANNNYEERFAALEKRVTDLEDKTKTQEEEINELKAEIGTLNNNNSKNTTVNYYSTNNNYTNKIYPTEKETIVKENTDNNAINNNSTLNNEEAKNSSNNVEEEIKKLNDKIDELKKELTPDEYWMIGKWESLSETQVYQFEINKDGSWQTRDGKEKGIYDDNKLIIINDYTLNSKHSIYYTFLKQSNESAKLTLNIDNGYTSYHYNNNVSSFKAIVNKVNDFSKVETEVQKIELKINNPIITNYYDTIYLNTTIYPRYLSDNITYSSSNENVATIINSDELKSVSNGKTIITAKSSNGKTSSVEVTVNMPANELPEKVEIQNFDDNMTVGDEKQLSINYYPEDTINKDGTWYSSDDSIISVTNNGLITAKNEGTATITYKSVNYKTSSIEIVVKKQTKEYPDSVKIQNCDDMTIGDEKQLTINFDPETTINKDGKWYTSDPNIISITDNGFITAKNIGSATITFESSNKKTGDSSEIIVYPTKDKEYLKIKNTEIYNDDNLYLKMIRIDNYNPSKIRFNLDIINRAKDKYCLKLSTTSNPSLEGDVLVNDKTNLKYTVAYTLDNDKIYLNNNTDSRVYLDFDVNNLLKNNIKKVNNFKFYIQVYKVNGDNDNNLEYLYTTNQITISNE